MVSTPLPGHSSLGDGVANLISEVKMISDISHKNEIQFQTNDTPPEVARFWVEGGQLKFEGNADVAAQAMFDMLRDKIDEYVAERLAA